MSELRDLLSTPPCLVLEDSKKGDENPKTSTWRVEDKRLTLACHDNFIKGFTEWSPPV